MDNGLDAVKASQGIIAPEVKAESSQGKSSTSCLEASFYDDSAHFKSSQVKPLFIPNIEPQMSPISQIRKGNKVFRHTPEGGQCFSRRFPPFLVFSRHFSLKIKNILGTERSWAQLTFLQREKESPDYLWRKLLRYVWADFALNNNLFSNRWMMLTFCGNFFGPQRIAGIAT